MLNGWERDMKKWDLTMENSKHRGRVDKFLSTLEKMKILSGHEGMKLFYSLVYNRYGIGW